MKQTVIWSLDPMFLFIYEYPQMGLITRTHTVCLPSCLSLIRVPYTEDHSLAGIYGTLVIFYIYPQTSPIQIDHRPA